MLSSVFIYSFVYLFERSLLVRGNANLPANHMPFYYFNFPEELEKCKNNSSCEFKDLPTSQANCWGYEDSCEVKNSFHHPKCPGDHKGWVKSKEEQLKTFYSQADFGYVRAHRDSVQILCEPTFLEDSALECSDHLQFCRGRNLLLNLTMLANLGTWRYKMDVLNSGDLAGWCHLYQERLNARSDHMSPLQSWAPEFSNFRKLPKKLNKDQDCDLFIERPTFILKIDATVNMYHHLCDFVNLYASLHVNSSHASAFTTDVQIIVWETYPYYSAFSDIWKAFSRHPVQTVDHYAGKTVCFRNVIFPLLPRMIFGLYYNTPLVYGCESSGLIKAFSEHVLHRLQIPVIPRSSGDVRVTLLSRETSYRNIINEKELIKAASKESGLEFRRVVFNNKLPFSEQLTIIRSTDIFIGMHGAGLTHLLFLPEWAAVFELYNCEDESCYFDLARLKGVKYVTWEKQEKLQTHGNAQHPAGGVHAKFLDYTFDRNEFLRILRNLVKYVRSHDRFVEDTELWRHDEL